MPRTRSKSPPDCGFARSLEAHRLFAGPEGRRQSRRGAALRKRKHRRRSAGGRACNEILPTIKKDWLHTAYIRNDQQSACRFLLKLYNRPFIAFNRKWCRSSASQQMLALLASPPLQCPKIHQSAGGGATLFPGESVEKSYQRLSRPEKCARLFLAFFRFYTVLRAKKLPTSLLLPTVFPTLITRNVCRLTLIGINAIMRAGRWMDIKTQNGAKR